MTAKRDVMLGEPLVGTVMMDEVGSLWVRGLAVRKGFAGGRWGDDRDCPGWDGDVGWRVMLGKMGEDGSMTANGGDAGGALGGDGDVGGEGIR